MALLLCSVDCIIQRYTFSCHLHKQVDTQGSLLHLSFHPSMPPLVVPTVRISGPLHAILAVPDAYYGDRTLECCKWQQKGTNFYIQTWSNPTHSYRHVLHKTVILCQIYIFKCVFMIAHFIGEP